MKALQDRNTNRTLLDTSGCRNPVRSFGGLRRQDRLVVFVSQGKMEKVRGQRAKVRK